MTAESRDHLRIFRRRLPFLVVPAVLGALIGFATTVGGLAEDDEPQDYSATHSLISDLTTPGVIVPPNLEQTALRVTAGAIPREAARVLGEGPPAELAAHVSAEADDELQAIRVTAVDRDPERAELLADTFAAALLTVLNREVNQSRQDLVQRLRVELQVEEERAEAAEAALARDPDNVDLQVRLNEANAERDATVAQLATETSESDIIVGLDTLEVANAAPVEEDGLSAPATRQGRIAAGALLGLLVGLAAALVLDRLNLRIADRHDAVADFGLPIAAEVPRLPRRMRNELITVTRPSSPFAESYRGLRSVVDLAFVDKTRGSRHAQSGAVVVVSSAGPSEGKTTTTAHLAASFAEVGRSVLAIDADFRRPRLHKVFGVPLSPGLIDLFSHRDFPDSPSVPWPGEALLSVARETEVEGVTVVPAGAPVDHPGHLFAHAARLVETARAHADVVLIDVPPLLLANDAIDLLPDADLVLVVARLGKTRRRGAQRTRELLDRAEAPLLGTVLIGTSHGESGYGWYYRYGAKGRRWWGRRRASRGTTAPSRSATQPMPDDDEIEAEVEVEAGRG